MRSIRWSTRNSTHPAPCNTTQHTTPPVEDSERYTTHPRDPQPNSYTLILVQHVPRALVVLVDTGPGGAGVDGGEEDVEEVGHDGGEALLRDVGEPDAAGADGALGVALVHEGGERGDAERDLDKPASSGVEEAAVGVAGGHGGVNAAAGDGGVRSGAREEEGGGHGGEASCAPLVGTRNMGKLIGFWDFLKSFRVTPPNSALNGCTSPTRGHLHRPGDPVHGGRFGCRL